MPWLIVGFFLYFLIRCLHNIRSNNIMFMNTKNKRGKKHL